MNRWMVLSVLLALLGVWAALPWLRLVPEASSVRLFAGLALGAFALGYMPAGDLIETDHPVRLWRRFTAFLIDMIALFLVLHPLLSLISPAGAVVIGPALVFCYFWLHAAFGRATPGQYVMAYRIVVAPSGNTEPEYAHRVLSSFVATCLWPVTFISTSQADSTPGTYHWDRESGTRAVSVVALKR
ncbi:RDD family protein [Henriciella sp.]|uniref:RDD family protein n=1 Tax=Henriciella sp. TaxID=1968823 RepID=UPI00260E3117|nr:RDD family protein [Henriciella sp.]